MWERSFPGRSNIMYNKYLEGRESLLLLENRAETDGEWGSNFPKWLGETALMGPHEVCKPRIPAIDSSKTEAQIHHTVSPRQVLMKTKS